MLVSKLTKKAEKVTNIESCLVRCDCSTGFGEATRFCVLISFSRPPLIQMSRFERKYELCATALRNHTIPAGCSVCQNGAQLLKMRAVIGKVSLETQGTNNNVGSRALFLFTKKVNPFLA